MLRLLVAIAFLSVPFLLCVLAVWRWRGGSRLAAVILMAVTGYALAIDIYGVIQGGNLAGILTITASVPTLLFLAILAVARNSSKRRTNEEEVDSGAEVTDTEADSE